MINPVRLNEEKTHPFSAQRAFQSGRIATFGQPHSLGAKTEHLSDDAAAAIFQQTCDDLAADGYRVLDSILSPIRGKGGGVEYLALIEPTGTPADE